MIIETRLTAVVVYTDRARVTREGGATLPAGDQRVIISGLPLRMEPASLRVTARGAPGARLLGADVRRVFVDRPPIERMRELEEQILALKDALKALAARHAWLNVERASLESTLKAGERFAGALSLGKLDLDAHFANLQRVSTRADDLTAELIRVEAEQRTQEKHLERLEQEYQQYERAKPRELYEVQVDVSLAQETTLTFILTYIVTGARWTPRYDLRWRADGRLEVSYLAEVTQQSGEPWQEVDLTLSTARPSSPLDMPQLKPWALDVLEAIPVHAEPDKVLMRAAAFGMPAMAMAAPEQPVEEVTAQVEQQGTVVSYRLPIPVTVPPDGSTRKVMVARFELEPELSCVSAPKLEPVVYRQATITNKSPYTWLPGEANLFWDEEFIGRVKLALLPPEGQRELVLGIEDRVRVERKQILHEVDKRIIGERRRIRMGYEITLENLLDTPITLELRDQIPYAKHEQIKVRLENASPSAEEQELGLLRWTLKLAPRSKKSVRFEFTVEYPVGLHVVGLD